jgi:hypothetical protein
MALMVGQTSIAAGATVNVLAGQQFEFLPSSAFVEFGISQAAAAGLLVTVFSGTDLLQQSSAVPNTGAAPVYPDQFQLNDHALKGDRLQISANNPTGGALLLYWAVKITPM